MTSNYPQEEYHEGGKKRAGGGQEPSRGEKGAHKGVRQGTARGKGRQPRSHGAMEKNGLEEGMNNCQGR